MNSTTLDQVAAAAEIAAYITELDFDVMQSYCTTSAVVLLAYHYITTLDDEATHFWAKAVAQKGRVTLAWILFFANRYLPLVNYVYQAPWWPVSTNLRSCATTVISQYLLEYSQYALWAVISCFRVHALRKSKLLTLLVLFLALAPVFCDAVLATYFTPAVDPVDGCVLDASRLPFRVYEILDVFAYTGWVLSEVLVVAITLTATRHHKALAGALGRGRRSLSAVLFEDGLVFFVIIMMLNITQLIVNLFSLLRPTAGSNSASAVLTVIAPLTSILLTRLYFDLQQTVAPAPQVLDAGQSTEVDYSFGYLDVDARLVECGDAGAREEAHHHAIATMRV